MNHSKRINNIIKKIQDRQVTLAFAESVTCGFIAQRLGNIKGASEFFMGSVVCYNSAVKTDVLSVPKTLIKKYSAESMEVTQSLAKNLSRKITADFYGAVTGLATDDPKSKHPAGTIFMCIYHRKKLVSQKKLFKGTPLEIRKKAFTAIMEMIAAQL